MTDNADRRARRMHRKVRRCQGLHLAAGDKERKAAGLLPVVLDGGPRKGLREKNGEQFTSYKGQERSACNPVNRAAYTRWRFARQISLLPGAIGTVRGSGWPQRSASEEVAPG